MKNFVSLKLVEAICSGQPRPQVVYIYGDLGVGKSTFLTNLADFTNKNFYVKNPEDIIENPPETLGFGRSMAILIKSTPKSPKLWLSGISIKGIGYELPKTNDDRTATWYLHTLLDKIYENAKPEVKAALKNRQEVILRRLGEEQVVTEIQGLVKEVLNNPTSPLVDLCESITDVEGFMTLFKLAKCLCVLILDQIEIEGYTNENFTFLASLVKKNKSVLIIIADNVSARQVLGYPGGRLSKADAAIQNLLTLGEVYTMKGITDKRDYNEILDFWLQEKNPFSRNAVEYLVKDTGSIPRLFLDLAKRSIDEAALQGRKRIDQPFLESIKRQLSDEKIKYRTLRAKLVTSTAVTPEDIEEELKAVEE